MQSSATTILQQISDTNNKIQTLTAKRERCAKLCTEICKNRDIRVCGTPERWYYVQNIGNITRGQIIALMDVNIELKALLPENIEAKRHEEILCQAEEKRAIKEANVTSSTYERSKKALSQAIEGYLAVK